MEIHKHMAYTKILEVNLFAFAHRLFRRDFSPLDRTYCMGTHSFLHLRIMVNSNLQNSMVCTTLTLTVLAATIDAQWEGMGDVGSARYEPALLPPCLTIRVLSYSN